MKTSRRSIRFFQSLYCFVCGNRGKLSVLAQSRLCKFSFQRYMGRQRKNKTSKKSPRSAALSDKKTIQTPGLNLHTDRCQGYTCLICQKFFPSKVEYKHIFLVGDRAVTAFSIYDGKYDNNFE